MTICIFTGCNLPSSSNSAAVPAQPTAAVESIEELVKTDKATTLEQLQSLTGFGTGCGKCREKVEHLFEELRHIYGKS